MSEPSTPTNRVPPVALLSALAVSVVLVRWTFQAFTGATFEDSLISLRYAQNLVAGHGMVYNVGERVFGASTPLYVLFLAGLLRLELPALLIAKLAAAALDGVTLFLWGRFILRETGRTAPVLLFSLLFGLSPLMTQVSVSGMETSFALLLLTLAFLSDRGNRPAWCGLWLGLLTLVRPDGLLAAAVLLGMRWWQTRHIPVISAVIAAAVVAPWVIGATWYYGSPLPNSIPAKAAAYNLHRESFLPNVWGTLAELSPSNGPFNSPGRFVVTLVLLPCLVMGLREAWLRPAFRPLTVLFAAWWAYLILPRTLLFTWYFPLLLLPAYALAALGLAAWQRRLESRPLVLHGAVAVAAAGALVWLVTGTATVTRIQHAETSVRRALGLWLREHTPEDARVALEPIGYIGYYSQRRVLDAVGLVSPEMIPLNRQGDGWFGEMVRRFRPEYVVERPFYLLRNRTLNSGVPMFRTSRERNDFLAEYRAVAAFSAPDLPKPLLPNYSFVVFELRPPEEAAAWRARVGRLAAADREALLLRALTGPVTLHDRTVQEPGAPRTP
jgi:hypothetical protein